MRNAGKSAEAGFTLLEMTVALSIAGLVFVGIGQGLQFGIRALTRQTVQRAESRALIIGWRDTHTALARMDAGSLAHPAMFQASPGRLAFTMALPDQTGMGKRRADVELLVDGQHRLMLLMRQRDRSTLTEQPIERQMLAEGVASVEFSYRPKGSTGAWLGTWTGPALPGLVRMSVTWDNSMRTPWPPIIAGPAIVEPAQ